MTGGDAAAAKAFLDANAGKPDEFWAMDEVRDAPCQWIVGCL
jgi:hypothetical protein